MRTSPRQPEYTAFSKDVLGRYVCNGLDEALASMDTTGRPEARPFDTIVIGGGQAGLAAGYYLRRARRQFLILDANQRSGDAWRQRWDSLLPSACPLGEDERHQLRAGGREAHCDAMADGRAGDRGGAESVGADRSIEVALGDRLGNPHGIRNPERSNSGSRPWARSTILAHEFCVA